MANMSVSCGPEVRRRDEWVNPVEGLGRQVWLAIVFAWGGLTSTISRRSITQVGTRGGLAAGQASSYLPRSGRTGGVGTPNNVKRG